MKEEVDQECLKNKIYLTFTLQLLSLEGWGIGGGACNISSNTKELNQILTPKNIDFFD
jgi:hypothetical protein